MAGGFFLDVFAYIHMLSLWLWSVRSHQHLVAWIVVGHFYFLYYVVFYARGFFFRSLSSNRNKEITMRLNENPKRRWDDATDKRHGLKQVIISAKGNSIKQHILSLLISYECMSVWRYALLKLQSDQTSDGLQHTTTGIQQRRNKNDAFYYCLSHYRLLPST